MCGVIWMVEMCWVRLSVVITSRVVGEAVGMEVVLLKMYRYRILVRDVLYSASVLVFGLRK